MIEKCKQSKGCSLPWIYNPGNLLRSVHASSEQLGMALQLTNLNVYQSGTAQDK